MQGTGGAPGAEGCPQGLIEGLESAAHEDVDSSYESLRERILKIVTDRGVLSSRSQRRGDQRRGDQREGEQGKDIGAPVLASGEKVAQPAGSSQLGSAPPPPMQCRAWESRYGGLDIFSSSRLMGCSCGNGLVRVGL